MIKRIHYYTSIMIIPIWSPYFLYNYANTFWNISIINLNFYTHVCPHIVHIPVEFQS